MTDAAALITINAETDADTLGLTIRVLHNGRIQIVTGEREWTLPLAESHIVASTAMAAMEDRT